MRERFEGPIREAAGRALLAHPRLFRMLELAQRASDRFLDGPPAWYARDNQFYSRLRMSVAHAPIVAAARSVLHAEQAAVLDLGCGNGALLRAIRDAGASIVPHGIDQRVEPLAHAAMLWPEAAEHFLRGDIFATPALWSRGRRYALVIVSLTRLLEVDASRAKKLREQIREHSDHLLVYQYGTRQVPGVFHESAAQLRLELIDPRPEVPVCLARP